VDGAEIIVTGKEGFGQGLSSGGWVEFTDQKQLRQTTKNGGQITVDLQGRVQPFTIPEGAPDYPRPYTLGIEAQVEPENERSLLSMFADSILGVSGESAAGLIAPVIDTMKTIHWTLDDQQEPFFDWQVGWKLNKPNVIGPVTGLKCDPPDKPWVARSNPTIIAGGVSVSEKQTWTVTITDPVNLTGTYEYRGVQTAAGAVITTTASGTAKITLSAEGALMVLSSATSTIRSPVRTVHGTVQGWHFQWEPTADCPRH
jgi:hypothetical protein